MIGKSYIKHKTAWFLTPTLLVGGSKLGSKSKSMSMGVACCEVDGFAGEGLKGLDLCFTLTDLEIVPLVVSDSRHTTL
jgi:hypothetical protein